MKSTSQFYTDLPIYSFDILTLFKSAETFSDLPSDWYVIATDIIGSTELYNDGRSEDVWKLAAAGIDVLLKSASRHNIEIPYVYSGDGILACFPPELHKEITIGMMELYDYGRAVVGVNLRIGIIPVEDITSHGFKFRVKRVGSKGTITHSLFDDSAFAWIDSMIKTNSHYEIVSLISEVEYTAPDFETYVVPIWQKLDNTFSNEEFMSLIISQQSQSMSHLDIYQMVCEKISEFAPRFFTDHPIVAMEKDDILSLDFIKTDGFLKLTLSGSRVNLEYIIDFLHSLEEKGVILFGHSFSSSSLITFIVKESNNYLAGLLDISDGGYFVSAQELKKKIQTTKIKNSA